MLISCAKQCDNQMETMNGVVAIYDDIHQSFVRKKNTKIPLQVDSIIHFLYD